MIGFRLNVLRSGHRISLSDFDPVIPAIAKVIDLAECPFPVQRFDQSLAGLRVHGRPPSIGVGNTVTLTSYFKLMQMVIVPAHCDLDHRVQFA